MSMSDSETPTKGKDRVSLAGFHRCVCSSPYCREIMIALTEAGDPRGGHPIRLHCSAAEGGNNSREYFDCVCRHLHVAEHLREEIIRENKRYCVARHHYKPELLAIKGRITTLLSEDEAQEYLYRLDEMDKVVKKNKVFYRKVPNVPLEYVQQEAKIVTVSSSSPNRAGNTSFIMGSRPSLAHSNNNNSDTKKQGLASKINPAAKLHKCCCSSPLCRDMMLTLTNLKDPRGGDPIRFLYSDTPLGNQYFECLCRHLNISDEKKERLKTEKKRFSVARHHWLPELHDFGGNYSSLLPEEDARQLLYECHEADRVEKHGKVFYMKAPNVPFAYIHHSMKQRTDLLRKRKSSAGGGGSAKKGKKGGINNVDNNDVNEGITANVEGVDNDNNETNLENNSAARPSMEVITNNIQQQRSNNHVHVLTMGGTIDKDYPRLTSGYAFEFGDESAASRVLKNHPNLGVTFDVTSVCAKDSLEIDDGDREFLMDALKICLNQHCTANEGDGENEDSGSRARKRIVITHGTDTMIETALYIQSRLDEITSSVGDVVIAFTGATKPERFIDSDAPFNLGCAVGATSFCSAGSIVICMNGNCIPAEDCIRGEDSGLFEWRK